MPCCIQHAIDTILYHIYIYKYNHYNYHWKDLQCASLKVLFDKRNARTIEMRSHYKKLAYGLRGSVMNSPSSFIIGNICRALLIDETYPKII
jgi:hypothetical protein